MEVAACCARGHEPLVPGGDSQIPRTPRERGSARARARRRPHTGHHPPRRCGGTRLDEVEHGRDAHGRDDGRRLADLFEVAQHEVRPGGEADEDDRRARVGARDVLRDAVVASSETGTFRGKKWRGTCRRPGPRSRARATRRSRRASSRASTRQPSCCGRHREAATAAPPRDEPPSPCSSSSTGASPCRRRIIRARARRRRLLSRGGRSSSSGGWRTAP